MIYLVLSAVCLALLHGVYRLALSRTTLHRFNRSLLLSILVLSAVLPAVRIDGLNLNNKVADAPTEMFIPQYLYADEYAPMEVVHEPAPMEEPVGAVTSVVSKPDARTSVSTGVKMVETLTQMDWVTIITYLYLMGVAFFMIRLLIGIIRVETLCRLGGRRLSDGSRLLVCDGQFQPTSWRHTIIISRSDYESDNSRMIIEHEQAHIHHGHSIDVLLAQMVCALQWFNPAAWALKRSLQEVHEYEADAAVLADGLNERQYQLCLVKAALSGRIGYVTSNFADCSTKKRITMMKRSQSSPFVCLRALLMLPVVLVIILFASACKPKASQDNNASAPSESITDNIAQPVPQLEPLDTTFMKKFGLGANQDLKIKQLNIFVEVEWDGGIWITLDGEQTFHPATLDNFAAEFERLKKESTVEVARPDLVFVTCANDAHLDIAQNIIKQLQKSYSDDKILLITLPYKKTVPPPPTGPDFKTVYNVNYETDKWVRIMIDRKNNITMTAHNVSRLLNSAQDIVPTLEGLKVTVERDSIDVEIKANNTIILRIPEITKTFSTPVDLKRELKRLYSDTGDPVYWMVTFDARCATRVENEVNDIFKEEPFTDKYKVRIISSTRIYPPMPTRRDSIKQILIGRYGRGDRSRHVKNMKWYNDNKDKEEFFRMGFKDGQIYVGKGNDPSNMRPIEFDQLVPYFRENCPDGDERKAIVLFEIATDDESVSVAFMDKVLSKMEDWVTTLTRRIWVSDKHIE